MSKIGIQNALNSVRETSSQEFQEVVPVIDENTSIAQYTAPLLNTPKLFNEFCDVLVQRIVYTQVESKIYNNPLRVLEGEAIPLGYLGQEIFINPAQGRDYDVNDFAGALSKYESDTKVQYMGINFDKQYPVTIIREKLKQAFVSWEQLEAYINALTSSLYNGYYIDAYRNSKALVTNAYRSNAVQIQTIEEPTTDDTAKKFVEIARTMFLNFQAPTPKFNAWRKVGGYGREIVTFTEPDNIIIMLRNDIRSKIDVGVLAQAFNIDRATLLGNMLSVDDFSIYDKNNKLIYDGSNILGIICDKSWFRIKTQDEYMDEFRNANNRSINYYLNVIKMYNYSFFANAVVLATAEPQVAITGLDFKNSTGVTLKANETLDVEVYPTPSTGNTPDITFESGNTSYYTVEKTGNTTCKITGKAEGSANLTAKAGNVNTTLSVTVESAE